MAPQYLFTELLTFIRYIGLPFARLFFRYNVFIYHVLNASFLSHAVPAHFIEKFSLLTAKQGDTSKLVCDGYGTRPIRVTWLRQRASGDMVAVSLDGSAGGFSQTQRFLAFQKNFQDSDRKTVFELHILNSQLNDSGLYVCKVFNEFGEDAHNIELTVLGK